MIDLDRMAAIRQREQAATKGPWIAWTCCALSQNVELRNPHNFDTWEDAGIYQATTFTQQKPETSAVCAVHGEFLILNRPDADFIAAAREDIPYLLDVIQALVQVVSDR